MVEEAGRQVSYLPPIPKLDPSVIFVTILDCSGGVAQWLEICLVCSRSWAAPLESDTHIELHTQGGVNLEFQKECSPQFLLSNFNKSILPLCSVLGKIAAS